MKVFVTRHLPGKALALLSQHAQVEVWPEAGAPPRAVLLNKIQGCDGLISLLTDRVDQELLAAAPNLKVVSNVAVGVDNVDLAACSARGIPVGHTPGVLTETTADFAFALLLAAARRVVEGDRYVRSGEWKTWDPSLLLGTDVYGATLAIVGRGKIGSAVAKRAEGYGMQVLPNKPLAELLPEADFVSLHVPLTDQTRHLIGAPQLALMKRGAILINTARGPVVDQDALAHALRSGQLAAAALDVMTPEPLPPGHPLLDVPQLLLTPHIASATTATRARMALLAVENLLAGLAGKPLLHRANP